MAIKYDRLISIMRDKGINSYVCKRDKIIGQESFKKIHNGGNIDMRTLNSLCKVLGGMQPGDLIEYVEDEDMD